eukprot:SAG31_NODE_5918_length_2256_cov_2.629578_3_plen_174_part_01
MPKQVYTIAMGEWAPAPALVPAIHDGRIDALVTWQELELSPGLKLSNNPLLGGTNHRQWAQTAHLLRGMRSVAAGEHLQFEMLVTDERLSVRLSGEDTWGEGFWNARWYNEMVNDEERNVAYRRALHRILGRGDARHPVVLDIGSGEGLLSLIASNAGAEKVFAVEVDPTLSEA